MGGKLRPTARGLGDGAAACDLTVSAGALARRIPGRHTRGRSEACILARDGRGGAAVNGFGGFRGDAPTTFPTTVEFDRLLDMGAPALLAIAARKGLGLGHGKGVARLVDLAGSDPDWRHLLLDVFGPGKPPLCLNKANAWTNSYIYEARDKEMLAAFLKVQVRANPDAFAVAIVTSLTLDRAKQALAMLASGARPSVRLLEERGPAMRRYVSPDTLAVLEGLTSAHGQLALLRGSRPLAELLVSH